MVRSTTRSACAAPRADRGAVSPPKTRASVALSQASCPALEIRELRFGLRRGAAARQRLAQPLASLLQASARGRSRYAEHLRERVAADALEVEQLDRDLQVEGQLAQCNEQ